MKTTTLDIQNLRQGGIADVDGSGAGRPGKLELRQAFIELRAQGLSLEKCARRLGLAKATLCSWSHELEGEISQLRAVALEALHEQFFLAKQARIRLLGRQLAALGAELKKRDLAEVPTAKLLDLQMIYYKQLREEFEEPRPLTDAEVARLRALRQTGAEDGATTSQGERFGKTESGPKMNAAQLAREMELVYRRQQLGLLASDQAREELGTLQALLKAYELSALEAKYDRLAQILASRGNQG